ncbi:MAG: hypothetical protein ACXVIJ_03805 [Thermoanaerobaculia bacterium]
MTPRGIHVPHDFFEYSRVGDSVPPASRDRIDIALLDMNHNWPNLGHDSLVFAVHATADLFRDQLISANTKVRVLSFDVRKRLQIPAAPNGQFAIYLGTGGPGHLDPKLNDGIAPWSQGIREIDAWEAPLFRLFDSILSNERAALIGVCHTFGLLCRWSGAARVELRDVKSSGMPLNSLTAEGIAHPWFSRFAEKLPDHRHYRVIDNRLFDLRLEEKTFIPIAFESDDSDAVTMIEFARSGDVPRILGMNHHPEIIDRDHMRIVLEEKRTHQQVSDEWYRERRNMIENEMSGEHERQSRITSEYTLLAPLRAHLGKLIEERIAR